MNNIFQEPILILAPHPDDAEFGMGGVIAQRLWDDAPGIYAFSGCRESVPDGYLPNSIKVEFRRSARAMGLMHGMADFPVRRFNEHRQDILEKMVWLRGEVRPRTVFVPASGDVHQDHEVIRNEAVRAFKNCTILGYELPWNHLHARGNLFAPISRQDLDDKIEFIKIYKTQAGRPYSDPRYIEGVARTRGIFAGCEFAEAFEVIKIVLQ